jgi:NTP pyrophosphatase (non-canonical NTP hydrolase)
VSDGRGVAGALPLEAAIIAERLAGNGFDSASAVNRQVLNLAEEVGEFVGAFRRWTGQARRSGTAQEMHEELADVVITAFVTAHELRVDIEPVIAAKLSKVHTRGWRETAIPSSPRQGG